MIHFVSGTAMGTQLVMWGFMLSMYVRSRKQPITMWNVPLNSSQAERGASRLDGENSFTMPFTRYREPAHSSFVDLEDVPEAKSSCSTHATERPRNRASRATPAP